MNIKSFDYVCIQLFERLSMTDKSIWLHNFFTTTKEISRFKKLQSNDSHKYPFHTNSLIINFIEPKSIIESSELYKK